MLIFITFKTVHSLPAGFAVTFTRSCYMVTSIRIFARLTTFVLTIWSIETNVTLCKENANILITVKIVKLGIVDYTMFGYLNSLTNVSICSEMENDNY